MLVPILLTAGILGGLVLFQRRLPIADREPYVPPYAVGQKYTITFHLNDDAYERASPRPGVPRTNIYEDTRRWIEQAGFTNVDRGVCTRAARNNSCSYTATWTGGNGLLNAPWFSMIAVERSPAVTPVSSARVGQAFQGTISAEVVWESHAAIDAWLAERLASIMRTCEDDKARALAQNRSDNRRCWSLIDPTLIASCLLNNGTRWRNTIAAIDAYCEGLRAEARAYAAQEHARLDAKAQADARASARVPLATTLAEQARAEAARRARIQASARVPLATSLRNALGGLT